jgi:cystathionine beta-synthase
MYHENILDLVRNTPLVKLNRVCADLAPTFLAKVERISPTGSVKDRVAVALVEDLERRGLLKPGGTVVEGTSGNTGIGLAMVCAQRGYKCIITMPEKMSRERELMLKAFGATVIRTRTDLPHDHPDSYSGVAARIAAETPGAALAGQFTSPANPDVHYRLTGPEIWRDAQGHVDAFVMGMGTGGSISGVGRYLKEQNPQVRILGAEPTGSGLKTFFDTGVMPEGEVYQVEGIGNDYVPDTLNLPVVDAMEYVSDAESFYWARRIAREEGILVGGSSGTILGAARRLAKTMRADQTVVVVLCDSGERYLSKFLDDDWMRANGYDPQATFA